LHHGAKSRALLNLAHPRSEQFDGGENPQHATRASASLV